MNKAHPHIARIHFNQTVCWEFCFKGLICSFYLFFKHPQIDAKSPSNIYADEIIHVDNSNQIYFTGSYQDDPLERHVYR
jgi:hypothetical protein